MIKLIFLWVLILASSFGFGASTYQLPRLENITINEFGICKKVINNGSNNYIVPTGIAADWSAFILHVPSDLTLANCSNDCVGSWGACVSGVQTYTITSPATEGGAACPASNGATQACGVNCLGTWGACSGGLQYYTVITPASDGGIACPNNNGDTKLCGVNGGWSSWSWSNCAGATCPSKEGTQTGTRSCTDPTPSSGGASCTGVSVTTRTCIDSSLNCLTYKCICDVPTGPLYDQHAPPKYQSYVQYAGAVPTPIFSADDITGDYCQCGKFPSESFCSMDFYWKCTKQ